MKTQKHPISNRIKCKSTAFTLVELLISVVVIAAAALAIFFIAKTAMAYLGQNDNSVKGSYTPPFSPLTVSVNDEGEFQVTVNGRVVTPIGAFSLELENKRTYYLEVTIGDRTKFYPLGKEKLKLELPSSLSGRTQIRYDGEGNIRILIPAAEDIHFD